LHGATQSRGFAVILVRILSLIALIWPVTSFAQVAPPHPDYVGTQACVECHADIVSAWEGSHHALAWTEPSADRVLGNFDDTEHTTDGTVNRFRAEEGDYWITVTETDGATQPYKVHSVVGTAPLQQYLLEVEEGRLQAFDVAWDVEEKRWFHLYPDQDIPPEDGLHWTGPYKNWNARCAECHATGFVKNYDPRTRRYQSTQAEIGVGCEGCHGPAEAHLAWANDASYDSARWTELTPEGFTVGFGASPETEIQQCAGCHSRREALGDGNPLPGTPYYDAYRLALLRGGLYHPDGTILDEVYVLGSFLQSKMYAQGVRCSDCHDVHTARLIAKGNAVCTQCHSPAGNAAFPSLKLAEYDDPAHHFHEAGSEGAQCKNCHMAERVYMQVDGRRDHYFRIPRPDLSEETGSPNNCNDCHSSQSPAWAAEQIATWYPESRQRGPHYGQVFAKARVDPARSKEALAELAEDTALPGIVRATALDLIGLANDVETAARLEPLLQDEDPLVRAAAIPIQRAADPQDKVVRILNLLSDPVASVRITAAREMLDAKVARLPEQMDLALRSAMAEWQESLLVKFDFPEGQMAIGGTGLVLRNLPGALQAFREAALLDPQLVQAWRMIITLEVADGNLPGAKKALIEALGHNPNSALLESISRQLR
jgi:hypothetical protein